MDNVTNCSVVRSSLCYNCYEKNSSYGEKFENPFLVTHTKIIFTIAFTAVCSVCVLGNTMVLFAIARSPRLRSMTNFFLANLAVADLCVGVFCVLPNLSTFLAPNWILGKAMCKIYYYVWNVSYTASIVILTVIAIERYIVIIYPLQARHFMTRRKLIVTQVIIWIVAVVYNIPYLIFYDTVEFPSVDIEFCYFDADSLPGLKGLSIANLIVWYVLPLGMMGILYYKIGRALWKTAVVSALRLTSISDSKDSSFRSCSTRTHHVSRLNSRSASSPEECRASSREHPNNADCNDDGTCNQDTNAVIFNARGTLTFICGMQKRSCSQQELSCFISGSPVRNSTEGDGRDSPYDDDIYGDQSNSVTHKKPSVLYRQARSDSSRKVAQARKKVIRLLTAIVISFSLCVLPHHLKVLNHFWHIYTLPHSIDVYISPCSFIILYLNSALNPILYALFSENFRKSFKETLPCVRPKAKTSSSLRVVGSN